MDKNYLYKYMLMDLAKPLNADENFLNALSHDLREPARMVSQLLKLVKVKSEKQLDQDTTDYLDYAINASDKMDDMIRALNKLNKAKLYEEEESSFSPSVLLEKVMHKLRNELKLSNARLKLDLDDTCYGRADFSQSVLIELISNSVKHAKSEAGLSLHVSVKQQDSEVQIRVEDNGKGVPDFWLKRAFDPFKKARKDSLNSGIGLTRLKIITEKFGGKIAMNRTEELHTCVTCTLS
jgi:chemotaxis family two-component system sensor kinase Cph1